MSKKKYSEHIAEFLNFISNAQSHYKFCCAEEDTQEKLTQDYLHSLELDNLKCDERSKIATKLVINRRDRRYYKDRVEELDPIVKFFEEQQNKRVLDKLREVLGQVRKQEEYHKNRIYIPKVLKEKKDG